MVSDAIGFHLGVVGNGKRKSALHGVAIFITNRKQKLHTISLLITCFICMQLYVQLVMMIDKNRPLVYYIFAGVRNREPDNPGWEGLSADLKCLHCLCQS